MSKCILKSIRREVSEYGFDPEAFNAEISVLTEKGKTLYFTIVDLDDTPRIYRTTRSTFEKVLNSGMKNSDEASRLSEDELEEVGRKYFTKLYERYGVYRGESYEDFYCDETFGGEYREAIRVLIYLVRCCDTEFEHISKEWIDKAIGDFEIPMCDVEEAANLGIELEELYVDDDEDESI